MYAFVYFIVVAHIGLFSLQDFSKKKGVAYQVDVFGSRPPEALTLGKDGGAFEVSHYGEYYSRLVLATATNDMPRKTNS